MKRIYANLLGNWTDITDTGTICDHQDPIAYFKEVLLNPINTSSKVTKLFEYDYINVQYNDKNYRIHPSQIQVVDE